MSQLWRVWYRNGTEPYSTLSLAASVEAIELTEQGNADFLRAEPATLTESEARWHAEHLLPAVKMAMEVCDEQREQRCGLDPDTVVRGRSRGQRSAGSYGHKRDVTAGVEERSSPDGLAAEATLLPGDRGSHAIGVGTERGVG